MYYVYLYRDLKGRIRYVGRGTSIERAYQHESGSHNACLSELVESGEYTVHIAGPYRDDTEMKAVEAALISAFADCGRDGRLCNDVAGDGPRFTPAGVPPEFAHRLDEGVIAADELPATTGTTTVFVNISRDRLHDGRAGYDPVMLLDDQQVLERIEKYWWFAAADAELWARDPQQAPGALVAGFGSGGRKTVIAAAILDPAAWPALEPAHGRFFVLPVIAGQGLDAYGLRGRRVSLPDGLRFNQPPPTQRLILPRR